METLLDLLYPPRCHVCGLPAASPGVCPPCTLELPWNLHACPACALPPGPGGGCIPCLYDPPPWASALAPLRYALPASIMIQAFKFAGRQDRGAWLGSVLAEAAAALPRAELPEAVVAVPLHAARERGRGFNQAQVIAAQVARALGMGDASRLVAKVRATPAQSALPAGQRGRNLQGAFATAPGHPLARSLLGGLRHVAVVDDVLTTGATARALTSLLHGCGIERVDVWCCARALPPGWRPPAAVPGAERPVAVCPPPAAGSARGHVSGTGSPGRGR